jgi:hypothetical protein
LAEGLADALAPDFIIDECDAGLAADFIVDFEAGLAAGLAAVFLAGLEADFMACAVGLGLGLALAAAIAVPVKRNPQATNAARNFCKMVSPFDRFARSAEARGAEPALR